MSELIRLNLLDWRGARREARRRQFLSGLVAAAIIAALLFGVLPHMYFGRLISDQQARNDYLRDQIAAADRKIKRIEDLKKVRSRIINRMDVIEELQNARPAIVHYFDQLVATVPEGVHLSSLKQVGQTTTLDGVAAANSDISAYMSNLANSAWFVDPRLVVIQRNDADDGASATFTLKVDSAQPEDDKSKTQARTG